MTGDTFLTERLEQFVSSSRPEEPTPSELEDLAIELVEQVSELVGAETVIDEQGILLDVSVEDFRCVIFKDSATNDCKPSNKPFQLSPRESEIARMIAKGYPNKTIAAVLEISTWTVNTHLRRMFAKCGVHSRAALIAKVFTKRFSTD